MKLVTGVALAVLVIGAPVVIAESSDTTPPQNTAQGSDATAKAAARRKRFEEEKRRLEENEGKRVQTATDSRLNISPVEAAMLIGEERGFSLFDDRGNNMQEKAAWSSSNPSVAELTGNSGTIVAKAVGTTTIQARIGGDIAEAKIRVYPGDKLPPGTIIWKAPAPGKGRTTQIVPATP